MKHLQGLIHLLNEVEDDLMNNYPQFAVKYITYLIDINKHKHDQNKSENVVSKAH